MKTIVPIVALLIIIGAGVYLSSYYNTQPKPGEPVPHLAPVACEACGKAYKTMLGRQPAKCFYCGEQKIWHARQCAQCDAIVPIVGGPSHGGKSPLECPKCGPGPFKEVSSDGLETH